MWCGPSLYSNDSPVTLPHRKFNPLRQKPVILSIQTPDKAFLVNIDNVCIRSPAPCIPPVLGVVVQETSPPC